MEQNQKLAYQKKTATAKLITSISKSPTKTGKSVLPGSIKNQPKLKNSCRNLKNKIIAINI
jgi:hypothetical protein